MNYATEEEQGMRKSLHQLKYLRSKWISDRTQKIIWLGIHQYMSTMKTLHKCFQFDDPKARYFATSALLRFSAEKSQKNVKTTDFNVFLFFSKQRWLHALDCDCE